MCDIITDNHYHGLVRSLAVWRDSGYDDRFDILSNDDLIDMDIYEFVKENPEKIRVYVSPNQTVIHSYFGAVLGTLHLNHAAMYRSNFGDVRFPCWADTINGHEYKGTFYLNTGYASLRRKK
jgi:hypothetical protein